MMNCKVIAKINAFNDNTSLYDPVNSILRMDSSYMSNLVVKHWRDEAI
jgi:hypothetical protein